MMQKGEPSDDADAERAEQLKWHWWRWGSRADGAAGRAGPAMPPPCLDGAVSGNGGTAFCWPECFINLDVCRMTMTQRRPLWFVLIAAAWGLLGYYFTLKIDAWGLQLADTFGATGNAVVLAAGAAWILVGFVPLIACLYWVANQPAWHPFRDAIVAGFVFALVPAFMHSTALGLGHIERDMANGSAAALVAGVAMACYMLVSIVTSFVAANKIWATPEPVREKRFGEKPQRF